VEIVQEVKCRYYITAIRKRDFKKITIIEIIALKMLKKYEKHKYNFSIKKENFIFLEGLKTPVSSM